CCFRPISSIFSRSTRTPPAATPRSRRTSRARDSSCWRESSSERPSNLATAGLSRAGERPDRPSRCAVRDQLLQTALARLFALCADHPVNRGAAVPRRLRVEECRGLAVCVEGSFLCRFELRCSVALERVDAGALRGP